VWKTKETSSEGTSDRTKKSHEDGHGGKNDHCENNDDCGTQVSLELGEEVAIKQFSKRDIVAGMDNGSNVRSLELLQREVSIHSWYVDSNGQYASTHTRKCDAS